MERRFLESVPHDNVLESHYLDGFSHSGSASALEFLLFVPGAIRGRPTTSLLTARVVVKPVHRAVHHPAHKGLAI